MSTADKARATKRWVNDIVAALSRRRMYVAASHIIQFSVTRATLTSGG